MTRSVDDLAADRIRQRLAHCQEDAKARPFSAPVATGWYAEDVDELVALVDTLTQERDRAYEAGLAHGAARAEAELERLREGLREIGREAVSVEPDTDHIARLARALLADQDGAAQTCTCPCGYPGPEPCNGCPDGCKRRPAGVTGWDHIDKPRGGAAQDERCPKC